MPKTPKMSNVLGKMISRTVNVNDDDDVNDDGDPHDPTCFHSTHIAAVGYKAMASLSSA